MVDMNPIATGGQIVKDKSSFLIGNKIEVGWAIELASFDVSSHDRGAVMVADLSGDD
jgi:hypothetical protein